MVQKSMTDVEKSIHEQSDKITEARKAIKERKQTIDNSDIVAESLSSENWKVKDFSFPDKIHIFPCSYIINDTGSAVVTR